MAKTVDFEGADYAPKGLDPAVVRTEMVEMGLLEPSIALAAVLSGQSLLSAQAAFASACLLELASAAHEMLQRFSLVRTERVRRGGLAILVRLQQP